MIWMMLTTHSNKHDFKSILKTGVDLPGSDVNSDLELSSISSLSSLLSLSSDTHSQTSLLSLSLSEVEDMFYSNTQAELNRLQEEILTSSVKA